jgi:predicted glycoside hydrolase/deacetylase ChbG (UPF0249 family)
MKRIVFVAFAIVVAAETAFAQMATAASPRTQTNLAQRLGYPPDAKLLIIHGDDLGMSHSVNAASIRAMERGMVNSASIMVPAPWFPEIAAYARKNPDADLGLHLTLTSEWTPYRWGPVLSRGAVPSLFDQDGYLYITEDVAAAHIDPREAEAEVRAQIEKALAFGIQPTHLDSHMRTLHQNTTLFEVQLRMAREYRIPAAVPRDFLDDPVLGPALRPDDLIIDRFISIGAEVPANKWEAFYIDAIEKLEPGVTELIVHIGYDDAEMRAATADHPDWGSAWRQRDFDFLTSDKFRRLLRKHNVKLITWRDIQKLMP